MMRLTITLVAALVLASPAGAQTSSGAPEGPTSGTIEGRINNYECGDNCYLTIVDKSGKKHVGLCTARKCSPWNDATELPRRYIGKKVVVTLGRGVQLDGNGDVVGHMTAFVSVRFVDR
jgi:hypothetical protein